MGTRGPKPEVVLKLSADERVELDAAIVEGKATKAELHVQFGEPHGISYRAFCTYAA